MNEHDIDRRLTRLERIEQFESRRLRQLEANLELVDQLVRTILRRFLPTPAAPKLAATFDISGDSMKAILVATIPTTRTDGSPLAATDIASITYQVERSTGTPPVLGPETTLQTNSAVAGAGLLPTDLTFTDPSANPGDTYTVFVTDTAGNISPLSNAEVAPASVTVAPPAAPVLAATFQ
jgi:hypothetical protein